MDTGGWVDEKSENRIYVGNLDLRINEAALIKMFSPYGKIISEDFLWHTRGPKKGEPRGYAFIQFSCKEEAELAKEKMHGRLACGRPLVVRLASEKHLEDSSHDHRSKRSLPEANRTRFVTGSSSSSGQMSRNEKVAAIKKKLKALEEDEKKQDPKKQKREKKKSVLNTQLCVIFNVFVSVFFFYTFGTSIVEPEFGLLV
ncbi:PREDICTED: probable RNA-binding protein 18 isoform X2 [Camelina sativa]|uniref:Probable RNA-binding protein 18 n=1 Tax=Camelina sativa TaxID=90675 RepID=A0ABM1QNS1_CAMSA|nr:PREDICTED: probable RNA-binding protein 18 isoform X2 [Camelina sativa]XP_019088409.1 PREDICTED: probable RNA-binding protein 18 isoform X2 [Camelina sativa]XP_019088410.1 PREDICTED: probable RNA-binding protein 18 isoform X2 [Camelina sativa]